MYRGTGEKQRALAVLASLFLSSSCVARPFSSFLYSSLKAPGRFSEATGAGGIRVELDYTAKGYIYRARMYAEARTSAQRGRPCGFSLDATSRVDSRIRCWPRFSHPARLSLSFSFSLSLFLSLFLRHPRVMDCPTFLFLRFTFLLPNLKTPPSRWYSRACPPSTTMNRFY